jgi:hypothetical protein
LPGHKIYWTPICSRHPRTHALFLEYRKTGTV